MAGSRIVSALTYRVVPTPFELRAIPDDRSRSRLFLLQWPRRTGRVRAVERPTTIGTLEGATLRAGWGAIAVILAKNTAWQGEFTEASIDGVDLASSVVPLDEPVAVRLALVFNTLPTLRAIEKVQQLSQGLQRLDDFDTAYWFDKITADPDGAATRALAVLLIGGA